MIVYFVRAPGLRVLSPNSLASDSPLRRPPQVPPALLRGGAFLRSLSTFSILCKVRPASAIRSAALPGCLDSSSSLTRFRQQRGVANLCVGSATALAPALLKLLWTFEEKRSSEISSRGSAEGEGSFLPSFPTRPCVFARPRSRHFIISRLGTAGPSSLIRESPFPSSRRSTPLSVFAFSKCPEEVAVGVEAAMAASRSLALRRGVLNLVKRSVFFVASFRRFLRDSSLP